MAISRKSSKRTTTNTNNNHKKDILHNTSSNKTESSYVISIIAIIIQSLIIYYLYNLEDIDCNCIRDWRHNYIKYFAILFIAYCALNLIIKLPYSLIIIIGILQGINIYAFFTYIGDLNETKCKCAIDKQPLLNSTMNVLRWVQVIIIIINLFAFIWLFMLFRLFFKK
jgi:hypothetical protein